MAIPLQVRHTAGQPVRKSDRTTAEIIRSTHSEELVLAICGPVGSGQQLVEDAAKKILSENFRYDVEVIKLSDFLLERLNLR